MIPKCHVDYSPFSWILLLSLCHSQQGMGLSARAALLCSLPAGMEGWEPPSLGVLGLEQPLLPPWNSPFCPQWDWDWDGSPTSSRSLTKGFAHAAQSEPQNSLGGHEVVMNKVMAGLDDLKGLFQPGQGHD